MTTEPPRRPTRLARALGLDSNPLRRASDRTEAWIRIGLLAVFLIAGPMVASVAGGWAYHATNAAPGHVEAAAPRSGLAPVYLGGAARAWTGTRSGSTTSSAHSGEALAVVMTLVLMALALLAVLRLTLAVLRRRRLAAWEAAWSRIGPQWSGRKP